MSSKPQWPPTPIEYTRQCPRGQKVSQDGALTAAEGCDSMRGAFGQTPLDLRGIEPWLGGNCAPYQYLALEFVPRSNPVHVDSFDRGDDATALVKEITSHSHSHRIQLRPTATAIAHGRAETVQLDCGNRGAS